MDSDSSYNKPHQHHQPSSSELLSSAKLVAEAAQSTFSHQSEKVDKGRVAGAAADLLEAASSYGKLEEKSFGKYVEKAENYLHQYHSSHSTTTTTTASGHSAASATHSAASGHSAAGAPHSTTHSSSGGGGGGEESFGGSEFGEYFKMAQGFLKKH